MTGSEQYQLLRPAEIFRVLSYVLFLLSLTTVAFSLGHDGDYFGFNVLVLGPPGLVLRFSTNWPWLGNLALFAAWLSLMARANVAAASFGIAAVVAALQFFSFPEIVYDTKFGMGDKIEHFGPGYWLWSASMVCALLAALTRLSQSNSDSPEADPS